MFFWELRKEIKVRKFPHFYVGTSGWSYRHWVGKFYPEDLKSHQFFQYYARHFSAVELNSSFYHLPREATVRNWLQKSPEEFRFCVKLSRFITHQKKLVEFQEPLERFFTIFHPLQPKMGPVLIQLPPSLAFETERLQPFLKYLQEYYSPYRFAVEARHKSWDSREVAEFLGRYEVALVYADSGGRFPTFDYPVTEFAYFRFHGPGRLYASNYSREQLAEFAEKIRELLEEGKAVWAFFNNDVGGYAVENAQMLQELVNGD